MARQNTSSWGGVECVFLRSSMAWAQLRREWKALNSQPEPVSELAGSSEERVMDF